MPKNVIKENAFIQIMLAKYLTHKHIADSNKIVKKLSLSYIVRFKNSQIFICKP